MTCRIALGSIARRWVAAALDCLRRALLDLAVEERVDFEKR